MIAQAWEGLIFKTQKNRVEKYLIDNDLQSGKVLDLGCGFGWYSRLFSGDYTGIDNDPGRLAIARAKYPGKKFLEMSADKLDFPDSSFDLVISFLVLHHLTDGQLTKALAEVRRVLKPSGKFLAIDLAVPEKFTIFTEPLMWLDGAERRTHRQLGDFFQQTGLTIRTEAENNRVIFCMPFFDILKG
ncbi:MAG: class I SAM-dependent methyltransferase [bacterium]|nr:class I SAM-dependent methyltransferase [bacterium]